MVPPPRRRAARAAAPFALALAAALPACGDDGGTAAPGTTEEVAPQTIEPGTPPVTFGALDEIYGPVLEPLGLRLTRAGVNEFERGYHLALYAVPEGDAAAAGPQGYLDRLLPAVQALAPELFDRFPALFSFDLCQEPVVEDATTTTTQLPPPVTLLVLTRDQFEAVPDWSQADLADLVAATRLGDGGALQVSAEVQALPAWQAAQTPS